MKKYVCEICTKSFESLDKHHINSLSKGGYDNEHNLAHICPNCHRLVHKGKLVLEGRFSTGKGNILVWRIFDQPSITGMKDPEVYLM